MTLTAGGEALVRGASRLALSVGVSPLVVGLTVVALGTSAPELVVAEWPRVPVPGPILSAAVRLLVPLMVVVSGALLWVGAVAPGGAFQAGVVLGTVLVLASLSGVLRLPRTRDWVLRAALALGFAVFLLVGAGGAALEGGLLQYPRAHAAGLILAVEAALTLSIGLVMAALFEGRPPVGEAR